MLLEGVAYCVRRLLRYHVGKHVMVSKHAASVVTIDNGQNLLG